MTSSVFEHLYQEELYILPARTLILLDKEWELLSEEEKVLLQKILGSVKLSPPAVQIMTKTSCTFAELVPFNPSKIISFGVSLVTRSEYYQVQTLEGVALICADPLSNLDELKKKNLWIGLRQMFGI